MNFVRKETKFLIPSHLQATLEGFLEQKCQRDIHWSCPSGYLVTSTYLDLPPYESINTKLEGDSLKEKFRIRTYDDQSFIFLEKKEKRNQFVKKTRIKISDSVKDSQHTNLLLEQSIPYIPYSFSPLTCPNIQPIVTTRYYRKAFLDETHNYLRFTIDTQNCFKWFNDEIYTQSLNLTDHIIFEIKHEDELPYWAQQLQTKLFKYKASFSKYYNAIAYLNGGKLEF